MKKNFIVGQSNELIKEGRIYDIHNSFDFQSIIIFRNQKLEMIFSPNSVYGKGLPTISIAVEGVDFLEISPRFGTEDATDIDEVGYKTKGDRDDNWLLSEKQATESSDLFFRFSGGHFVRFHSKSALLIELSL